VRALTADDGRLVSTFHVGLAKNKKDAISGLTSRQFFGANDICALMPRHKLVNLIARFNPRLLHIVVN
jgi:hypothetical protein